MITTTYKTNGTKQDSKSTVYNDNTPAQIGNMLPNLVKDIGYQIGIIMSSSSTIINAEAYRLKAAIECGHLLLVAKEQLGYGKYGEWFKANIEPILGHINMQTGARYMLMFQKKKRIKYVGSIRKAYIELGIIKTTPDVEVDVDDDKPETPSKGSDKGGSEDPKPAPTPAAAPLWKYGLPDSVLKQKLKIGGTIEKLLDNTRKEATRESLIQNFKESYADEIRNALATQASEAMHNCDTGGSKPTPVPPPEETDKIHTPLTEEQESELLMHSTNPVVIIKATLLLLDNANKGDSDDYFEKVCKQIRPIVDWYNEHTKTPKSSGKRFAKVSKLYKKHKVSVPIGTESNLATEFEKFFNEK